MAHLVETMAWSGETPWHGLGTKVSNDLTPAEMLKAAQLDWEVIRYPQFIEIGGQRFFTGKDVLVRDTDNSILTHIPEEWHETQNREAAEFFYDFVKEGHMEMHTAGSLKNGRVVWVLAKVKESFTILGRDKVDSYLLFSLPHEYGKSIDIRFTPIRVVCNNTLTLSLATRSDLQVRLSHRKKFDGEFVKRTLGISHQKFEKYEEMASFLASKRYTEETVREYFKMVFPKVGSTDETGGTKDDKLSHPARVAHANLENQPGAELGAGTWWSAFNAVTFSVDHVLGRSNTTRLESAWYGVNRARKNTALEKAREFALAA